jgi:hypothetical protein
LLSENIKIYRNTILAVILCGRETWSLTLRKEHRLRVFENGVLRRIFGPKGETVTGQWNKNYIVRSLMIRTPHQILFGSSYREELDGQGMQHVRGDERYIQRLNLRERDHLEDSGVDGWILLRCIFRK